nr:MAG TPA: hypothetical protein [Caudoviricetes sp.]
MFTINFQRIITYKKIYSNTNFLLTSRKFKSCLII